MESGTHTHTDTNWAMGTGPLYETSTRRRDEKFSPPNTDGLMDGWMDGGKGRISKAAFFGLPFSFSFYGAFFSGVCIYSILIYTYIHTYIHIFSQLSHSPILTLNNPPPPANRPRPTGRSSPPCRLDLSPRPRSRRCRPRRRCGPIPPVLRIRLRSRSRACSLHSHLRYHHDQKYHYPHRYRQRAGTPCPLRRARER